MLPTDPIDAIEEPSSALSGVTAASAKPGLKKTAATITRNFTSLLLGRLGCQVFNFTTNAYLARKIAPAGFGAIGVAQAIMGYLGLFSDSGLNVIAMREGAQNPSGMQALIGSITGLRLVLSCAFLPVGLLAAEFLPSLSDSSRTVLRIFALSLPLGAVALDWVFRALQRMQYNAILQVATAFLTLVLTLALVRGPHDLVRVPWAGIAAGAGVFLLSLHLLARTGHRLSVNLRLQESLHYLAHSFPLCAASLAVTLYTLANNLILGQVHGDAEVGIYVAATKLAGMCFVSTWIFHAAMSPALMGLYVRSRQDAARLLTESVRFTAVAGCGIV
ncbi:MAG: oligosaccharide flippase family protein, partial [Bryobacteraceae bacterium]